MPRKRISAATKAARKKAQYKKRLISDTDSQCSNAQKGSEAELYTRGNNEECFQDTTTCTASGEIANAAANISASSILSYADTATPATSAVSNAANDAQVSCNLVSGLPMQCKLASLNQSDIKFGLAAGKQCMPSCFIAIVENYLHHSVDYWSGRDIEELISHGTEMYMNYKPNGHELFSVDDLPKEFKFKNIDVQCGSFNDVAGVISKNQDENNVAFMNENMRRFFQDDNVMGVLVTMAGFTVSVLRGIYTFNILDTHARDERGRPNEHGYAGVFQFENLYSVSVYLVELSSLLSNQPYIQYELAAFQVLIKSTNRPIQSFSSIVTTPINHSIASPSSRSKHQYASTGLPRDNEAIIMQTDPCCNNSSAAVSECITSNLRNKREADLCVKTPFTKKSCYQTNPEYRDKKNAQSRQRYKLDEVFRNRKKGFQSKRYADIEFREGHKKNQVEYQSKRYADDIEFREGRINYKSKRYADDIEFREGRINYQSKRYADDIEFREGHKKNQVNYQSKRYADDIEFREGRINYQSKRYADDIEFREGHKKNQVEYQSKRYADDIEFREGHKKNQVEYQSERYADDVDFKEKKKSLSKEKNAKRKINLSKLDLAIEKFRVESKKSPDRVCVSCHRLMFENQVRSFRCDNYSETVRFYVTDDYNHFSCLGTCTRNCSGRPYVCHTCHSHLKDRLMPPQAIANEMRLMDQGDIFRSLNSLEQQLIGLDLPFEKLITLPRTTQKKIRGPVICVPSNVRLVTDSLPRPLGSSKIVPVKLKRKLVYKGHVDFQVIDSVKLRKALVELKRINPFYKNISINDHWDRKTDNNPLSDLVADNELQEVDEDEDMSNDDPIETIEGNVFDSCMQAIDVACELSAEDISNISIAPAEGNHPIHILKSEENVEAKAFPSLFPDGSNTFDTERKERKLSRSKYYDARMFSVDTRFAANTQYIFFAQYAKELEQLLSSISITLRQGTNSQHITPQMLLNQESLQAILKSDQGFRYFRSIRGSPEFWKMTMNDVFAMIRTLGIPTWFVTLSSAELSRWTCHLGAILKQQGCNYTDEEIINMDYVEKCKVIKSNPVTAVRMFYHRLDLFFRLILRGPCNPIGKVKDYFYRIEMQQRGACHVHMILWIEGAPKFNKNTDAEVCAYIDRYVKAELPDINADPELHEQVRRLQMHSKNHSKSCRKGKRKCRFNFPQSISEETFLARPQDSSNSDDMESKLKKLRAYLESGEELGENIQEIYSHCGIENFAEFQECMRAVSKRTMVVLRRNQNDVWVNNYNPSLLRAWNANIDIQFVLDPYACIMYIVSYISKSESELSEILKKARDEMITDGQDRSSAKAMRFLGHKYFTHREISVQEAIIRLCGMRLKQYSRQVVFVPANETDTRMSVPLQQIRAAGENQSTEIWMTSLHERFCNRPRENLFEMMCQAQFATDYRVITSKKEVNQYKNKENFHKLQNGKGYVLKRSRSDPAVMRYTRFSKTKDPEKYYLSLLLLYLPHRNKNQFKVGQHKTYQEFYMNAAVRICDQPLTKVSDIIIENQAKFSPNTDDIDEACDLLNNCDHLEDAWSLVAPNIECDVQDQTLEQNELEENVENIVEPIPGLNDDEPSVRASLCSYELIGESIKPQLRQMNKEQQKVFYHVREWCKQKSKSSDTKPFHIFVTGGAGTGKSHVIKCIYNMAHKLLRDPSSPDDLTVLLLAPTGTAAFNISGHTIHSALKIPLFQNKISKPGARQEFEGLKPDNFNTVFSMIGTVKIVIIDEFSMVSPFMLKYVDCRLKQIKGFGLSDDTAPFGKVSILAVGDFYQLPPVKAKSLISADVSAGHYLFIDNFSRFELTEVMRQRDDASFAHLLNRLRVKVKEDVLNSDDHRILFERVNRPDMPLNALHIFATRNAVNEHNNRMLQTSRGATIHVIAACDYSKDKTSGKMVTVRTPQIEKNESNGLPYELQLAVHCRVMLTKNLDVANGLVNGVFGTVVGFETTDNDRIDQVYVLFDSERVGQAVSASLPRHVPTRSVIISKSESALEKHSHIIRRQFPLKLGFAATVHKSQGMTVDEIVYDMDRTFSPGQAYVALSRVTSLNGLHLKSLKPSSIYMDKSVHANLNNLPLLTFEERFCEESFIVCHNVQSLMNKLEDMKSTYVKHGKILCITETWLSGNVDDVRVEMEGYNLFRTDRMANVNAGGSLVYVPEQLLSERITLNPCHNIEVAMCKVTERDSSYVIASVYRSGTASVATSVNYIRECIITAQAIPGVNRFLFTGDFNENLLNANSCHSIYNLFLSLGFQQCVNESTHLHGSLLDAVYVKGIPVHATVQPVYFSDHETVHVTFNSE